MVTIRGMFKEVLFEIFAVALSTVLAGAFVLAPLERWRPSRLSALRGDSGEGSSSGDGGRRACDGPG